jgi:hypothetical protein
MADKQAGHGNQNTTARTSDKSEKGKSKSK